jgi:COP9 signalosome complex subunit 2
VGEQPANAGKVLVAQQHASPTAWMRRELLSYTKTAVTRNQGEKKINSLLDHVSTSSNMRLLQVCLHSCCARALCCCGNLAVAAMRHADGPGSRLVQEFYAITLDALKEGNNERLWFKTNLKLCGLWFRVKEYSRAIRILKDLHKCASQAPYGPLLLQQAMPCNDDDHPAQRMHVLCITQVHCRLLRTCRSCQTDGGGDDLKKGTQLLEIYALEIQVMFAFSSFLTCFIAHIWVLTDGASGSS